jgi:hypothetical protein
VTTTPSGPPILERRPDPDPQSVDTDIGSDIGVSADPATVAPRIGPSTIGGAAIVVVGCGLLEARPALMEASSHPAVVLFGLFVGLGLLGAFWPLPAPSADATSRPTAARTAAVIALGLVAFGVGRLVGGGHPPVAATVPIVLGNTLAAVAEEAFFRRLCFGVLLPAGTVWAVVGSAGLFAVVHVTTYGWWVLPLDLAAGLVFGWQRATTGSWRAPAVTHVIVNLLVVL